MTIFEYFDLTNTNPISKLKLSYIAYLKEVYIETKDNSIKNMAIDIEKKPHKEILNMFLDEEYLYDGCSCNSGAIRIKKGSE
ncbi:MAG: hypothetical protein ACK5LC_13225 [Coprobacillaceae bacterium]